MFKVSKFGGSSLSSESQFQKVKNIVLSDPLRKVVVVSALGKRTSRDNKITDLLYILYAHINYSVPFNDVWFIIKNRYIDIKEKLKIDYDIEKELDILELELNKTISEDYLVSRGEYLTALLVSAYLGYQFIDAKDVIKFDYDGKVNYEESNNRIRDAFEKYGKIVVPGFYGSYLDGTVKLFSRGGSDITGAILAGGIEADVYENWTDVSGILMADPHIISNPLPIRNISYNELRELSYMGATVLHEETIFPVKKKSIPINIRNTNDPLDPGTIITEEINEGDRITGIAGKKDFMAITISKSHLSNEVGFVRKVLSIFEKYDISIEHVPTGIDVISVVVSNDQIEKKLFDVVSEIKQELGATVNVEKDIALIAVVGHSMVSKSGLSGRLFGIIGKKHINVKMIAQGPSEVNIIIGVKNSDYEDTVKAIYDGLVVNR